MSLSRWRLLWERLVRKRHYVGYDLDGNQYFEFDNALRPNRPRRMVDFKTGNWREAREDRLPVQWLTWLKYTRNDPPTIEELEADVQRKAILAHRVQLLDSAGTKSAHSNAHANIATAASFALDTMPKSGSFEPSHTTINSDIKPKHR